MNFKEFKFKEELQKAIDLMGFKETSPVQELSIPIVLEGYDLISQAQTGTGKTAAFGLPLIEMVDGKSGIEILVVVPTRELAIQVADELGKFSKFLKYGIVTIYGGSSYDKQLSGLKKSVIAVATPGRLIDLMEKKKVKLKPKFVVLDEADEMLNMGFLEDVKKIFSKIPDERQTLMFSATMPEAIKKLAKENLKNPKEVKITPKNISNENIKQFFYLLDYDKKKEALLYLLKHKRTKKSIIFCRTKIQTEKVERFLNENGLKALALHGDIRQSKRQDITKRFKEGKVKILVATDVAARGLDVKDLSHVFNYDIPLDSEPYVHRIGRTGRAGQKGEAHTFVSLDEMEFLKNIQEKVQSPLIPAEILKESGKEEFYQELKEKILNLKINKKVDEFLAFLKEESNLSDSEILKQLAAYILAERKFKDLTYSAKEAESSLNNFIKVKKNNRKRWGRRGNSKKGDFRRRKHSRWRNR